MKTYPEPQRFIGDDKVSRFSTQIEIANYEDVVLARRGALPADQVRSTVIRAVVDSGATDVVVPERVAKKLGFLSRAKIKVKYADGRRAIRQLVEGVHVKVLDRDGVFQAIVEPKRDSVLLGAIVLETLDLLADCKHERLLPRDPRYRLSEID